MLKAPTGRRHGGQEEEHLTQVEQASVWQGSEQERRERDAPAQERDIAARKERSRRQGEEPQAGGRDRALGGAEEGGEGATQEELAEEAAIKSAVLLTNGLTVDSRVLPLHGARKIAVVGVQQFFRQISSSLPPSCPYYSNDAEISNRECTFDFATDPALGDRGTSRVNGDPLRTVGPFAGISEIAGHERTVTAGSSAEEAVDADTVVVVVGYTPGDEGEEYYLQHGGDRSSLDLPPGHAELVWSVLDLNKPTVIIIESGSIVKRITVRDGAEVHRFQERVRALMPVDLASLAVNAGLVVEDRTDGPGTTPFDPEISSRFVLWMHKPDV